MPHWFVLRLLMVASTFFFYSFIIIVWGMGLKMGVGQPFLVCAVGFLYYYCEVGDEIV